MTDAKLTAEERCDKCGGRWHGGTPCMPFHREQPSSNGLVKRLRASLRMDAFNGDAQERAVCAKQMRDAADEIERLQAENLTLRNAAVNLQEQMERDRLPPTPSRETLIDGLRRIATMQPHPTKASRMRGLITHIQSIAAGLVIDATGESLCYGIDRYHLDRERADVTKEARHVAQHEETGRMWWGPKDQIPKGFADLGIDTQLDPDETSASHCECKVPGRAIENGRCLRCGLPCLYTKPEIDAANERARERMKGLRVDDGASSSENEQ